MRVIFGVLSLLVVVAIVGVLAKKQLTAAPVVAPSAATEPGAMPALSGTPQQQVQQYQKALQGAMEQQPRQIPDDGTR